jgi:hypothetical protein
VVATADEVGADRMWLELGVDRAGSGSECLRHDLAAIQTTPRITRSDTDKSVGSVVYEVEQCAGPFTK